MSNNFTDFIIAFYTCISSTLLGTPPSPVSILSIAFPLSFASLPSQFVLRSHFLGTQLPVGPSTSTGFPLEQAVCSLDNTSSSLVSAGKLLESPQPSSLTNFFVTTVRMRSRYGGSNFPKCEGSEWSSKTSPAPSTRIKTTNSSSMASIIPAKRKYVVVPPNLTVQRGRQQDYQLTLCRFSAMPTDTMQIQRHANRHFACWQHQRADPCS